MARTFGHILGVPIGTLFEDRRQVASAGVHRPIQHGISGAAREGADSIVVSGGYEDDEDYGDVIVYTGAGGRDPVTGQQIADQEFRAQNLALVKERGGRVPRSCSPRRRWRIDALSCDGLSLRRSLPGRGGLASARKNRVPGLPLSARTP
jgi:putative restriction endonuclease